MLSLSDLAEFWAILPFYANNSTKTNFNFVYDITKIGFTYQSSIL